MGYILNWIVVRVFFSLHPGQTSPIFFHLYEDVLNLFILIDQSSKVKGLSPRKCTFIIHKW